RPQRPRGGRAGRAPARPGGPPSSHRRDLGRGTREDRGGRAGGSCRRRAAAGRARRRATRPTLRSVAEDCRESRPGGLRRTRRARRARCPFAPTGRRVELRLLYRWTGNCALSPAVFLQRRPGTGRLSARTADARSIDTYEGVTALTNLLEFDARDFLDHAEELGVLDEGALEAFGLEHDLDHDELAALRAELEVRGVEVPEVESAETDDDQRGPSARVTHEVSGTTDSLTLFMNAAGRYPLLTAAEEVALAKRVQRGDRAAKERMINSNLRLVVSIAKRYQGHGLPLVELV